MNKLCRLLFFALFVRPIMLIVLGLNVRRREGLPAKGPAVLVANHNSHLDAVTLMSLFPLRMLPKIRPVAAQDYFFRNPWLKWFALRIMGILPLDREVKSKRKHPLAGINEALDRGEIVIVFPEGSRGAPEQLGDFKVGIAHIAKKSPKAPVIPIYMHGLGKVLPKGEALLVPFFLDVFIGEPIPWEGNKTEFMEHMTNQMTALAEEGNFSPWE
ncbi:MAG: 1-acyl-sn-glycerol-3-phosphate acyltransferase [Opitutae bacterium]|jgi:1-acyl-sn-glycerol-3-phosphate acyltransferase|nr:1-acyl-sn-glycerol-3-phosphate acyltransferase [Opitutae bacterium]